MIILFNPCLICDPWAVIYEFFSDPNTLYAFVCSERVTFLHPFFPTSENIFHVRFLKDIITSIVSFNGHDFGISFLQLFVSRMYVANISCKFSMGLYHYSMFGCYESYNSFQYTGTIVPFRRILCIFGLLDTLLVLLSLDTPYIFCRFL